MMLIWGLIPKGVWNHIEFREKLRNRKRQTSVADERPMSQQSAPEVPPRRQKARRGSLRQLVERALNR